MVTAASEARTAAGPSEPRPHSPMTSPPMKRPHAPCPITLGPRSSPACSTQLSLHATLVSQPGIPPLTPHTMPPFQLHAQNATCKPQPGAPKKPGMGD